MIFRGLGGGNLERSLLYNVKIDNIKQSSSSMVMPQMMMHQHELMILLKVHISFSFAGFVWIFPIRFVDLCDQSITAAPIIVSI